MLGEDGVALVRQQPKSMLAAVNEFATGLAPAGAAESAIAPRYVRLGCADDGRLGCDIGEPQDRDSVQRVPIGVYRE